jgi:nifR3 family TIM-barrel protein
MAGYSDVPFRTLCREFGSALSYIPCIADDGAVSRSRHDPRLADLSEAERPVAMQMLGKDVAGIVSATLALMWRRPDVVDINMGCPARRVTSSGRGSALLRDPALIGRLAAAVVSAVSVPVTAKIRLGWNEETRNYLEVARVLEDSGIAAIAVHGRTKSQAFSGTADWHAIGEVKSAVRVPVFANGDVRTVTDVEAIRRETGCDAVMIGRAAVGNPWIFSRRHIAEVGTAERVGVMERHLRSMVQYYGERLGVVLFRKHAVRYVQGMSGATVLRPRLIAASSLDQVLDTLGERSRVAAGVGLGG